jgi:hypothetical protein
VVNAEPLPLLRIPQNPFGNAEDQLRVTVKENRNGVVVSGDESRQNDGSSPCQAPHGPRLRLVGGLVPPTLQPY